MHIRVAILAQDVFAVSEQSWHLAVQAVLTTSIRPMKAFAKALALAKAGPSEKGLRSQSIIHTPSWGTLWGWVRQ